MPEYTLLYFNIRGLAELSRWIFAYSSIKYTDQRFENEEWPEIKKTIPGGKVPVLKFGDEILPQSLAIARYLAREVGLVPKDNFQAAVCDALADTLREVQVERYKLIFYSEHLCEEERNRKIKGEWMPNHLQPFLNKVNERMANKEWFISDQITWADILLGCELSNIELDHPNFMDATPHLAAHVKKIVALPAIKAWIDKRPVTDY